MKIRVPKKITKEIEAICEKVNSDSKPIYIPVQQKISIDIEEDCIENVARKIITDGGSFKFGWAFWEWPQVMLEAEFWAVWVDNEGQLIDVTPRGRGDKILFIADDKTKFNGRPIDSIVKPLINHPIVLQYIEINRKIWQLTDKLTVEGKTDMEICEVVAPLIEQKDAMEKEIDEKLAGGVGRNDLCPCGSGKKFKKCCGN